jgi:hypothetical protein
LLQQTALSEQKKRGGKKAAPLVSSGQNLLVNRSKWEHAS